MAAKKKGAGGNLARTQVVTVRLDPKLRFGAELAARKQRRTLSSFIEWAIEKAIEDVSVDNKYKASGAMNLSWDVEEADRFVKFALHFPELLNFREEQIWKLIKEHVYFWKFVHMFNHTPRLDEESADFPLIREWWETLQKVVDGEETERILPENPKIPGDPEEDEEDEFPW